MNVEVATRTALLVVFGVASVQKGRSRESFVAFAASLRALGFGAAARLIGYAVVAAEAAVVLLLAWPRTTDFGYLLALALLVPFAAGIVRASRSATPVACRCFGAGSGNLGVRHLIRNTLLAGLAVAGLLTGGEPIGAGAALAVVGGLAVALVLIRWDDVAYLVSPRRA